MAVLLELLGAQGTAVTMQLDAGVLIVRALQFIGAGAVGLILWFLQRLIRGVDELTTKVSTVNGEVKKVSQELFGPNGENGMRSELKRASRSIHKHERVLIELAVRNDIEIPEDEE